MDATVSAFGTCASTCSCSISASANTASTSNSTSTSSPRVLFLLVLAQVLKHSTYVKDPVELKSASHSFNRMVLVLHSYPKICDRGIGHSYGWIHGSFSFSWEHEADGIRPRGGTYNEYIMLDSASTCKIHKRYK